VKDLREIFERFDEDGRLRDKKNTDPMDEAMKIFNMFDKDGSGAIDAEGMRVRACTNVCMCTYACDICINSCMYEYRII